MYGLAQSTTSVIVRKCCEAIKVLVKSLVFSKFTNSKLVFNKVRGIPYIIGVVDDSHVNYCTEDRSRILLLSKIFLLGFVTRCGGLKMPTLGL